MPAQIDQYPVRNRLARETGAAAPEDQRNTMPVREPEQGDDLLLRNGLYHRLWQQIIEPGIRSKGDAVDITGPDPVGREQAAQLFSDLHAHKIWKSSFPETPSGPQNPETSFPSA